MTPWMWNYGQCQTFPCLSFLLYKIIVPLTDHLRFSKRKCMSSQSSAWHTAITSIANVKRKVIYHHSYTFTAYHRATWPHAERTAYSPPHVDVQFFRGLTPVFHLLLLSRKTIILCNLLSANTLWSLKFFVILIGVHYMKIIFRKSFTI